MGFLGVCITIIMYTHIHSHAHTRTHTHTHTHTPGVEAKPLAATGVTNSRGCPLACILSARDRFAARFRERPVSVCILAGLGTPSKQKTGTVACFMNVRHRCCQMFTSESRLTLMTMSIANVDPSSCNQFEASIASRLPAART